MRNKTAHLWLGAWLLVLPFLGISGNWKETLIALTGLVLIGRTLWLYRARRAEGASLAEKAETKAPEQPTRVE